MDDMGNLWPGEGKRGENGEGGGELIRGGNRQREAIGKSDLKIDLSNEHASVMANE